MKRGALVPHPDSPRWLQRVATRGKSGYGVRGDLAFPFIGMAAVSLTVAGVVGGIAWSEDQWWGPSCVVIFTLQAAALIVVFWRACYGRTVLSPRESDTPYRYARLVDPGLREHARPVYARYYLETLACALDPERRHGYDSPLMELEKLVDQFCARDDELESRRRTAEAQARVEALGGGSGAEAVADAKAYLKALDELNARHPVGG